jgi:hypothetical protein
MSRAVRVALAAAALALSLTAAPQGKVCSKCKSTGVVPCKEHGREDVSEELEVLYCSVVDGCEACGGVGLLDCASCDQPEKEARLAARKADVPKARERLAELDTTMGRALRKGESANFVLVWELPPLKVEKVLHSEHQMLHLTLQRLEKLHADYLETLQVPVEHFKKKSRVFVWQLPEDHRQASIAFCDMEVAGGAKLMGPDPNYSVCGNKSFFVGDEQLHRNLVHCVTHLLFSHQQPSNWIGNLKGGWIEEGLPHWFEDRYFQKCDNYCFQEQNTRFDFRGGNFKPALRALVEKGEQPTVAAVMQRNTDELAPAEHAVAMALVDYLIAKDAAAFSALGRDLRARAEAREALQERFKISILELEQALWPWVLANYPAER